MKKIIILFVFLFITTISNASFGSTVVLLNGTESVDQLNAIITNLQNSIQGLQIKQAGLIAQQNNKNNQVNPAILDLKSQLDTLKTDYKTAFDSAATTKKALAEAQADFESKTQEQDKLLTSIKRNRNGAIAIASTAVVVGTVAIVKNNYDKNKAKPKPVKVVPEIPKIETDLIINTSDADLELKDDGVRICGDDEAYNKEKDTCDKKESGVGDLDATTGKNCQDKTFYTNHTDLCDTAYQDAMNKTNFKVSDGSDVVVTGSGKQNIDTYGTKDELKQKIADYDASINSQTDPKIKQRLIANKAKLVAAENNKEAPTTASKQTLTNTNNTHTAANQTTTQASATQKVKNNDKQVQYQPIKISNEECGMKELYNNTYAGCFEKACKSKGGTYYHQVATYYCEKEI